MRELARNFTISEIAVRKHVQTLMSEQFIKERRVRQDIGRPIHLYSLTDKGHRTFPNKYETFPVELLQDLKAIQGEDAVEQLLQVRQERDESEIHKQLPDENFDQRLEKMLAIQEEKGYMIEYEKLENGDYKIKKYNCPLFHIVTNFKQICGHEQNMYENLFPKSKVDVNSYMVDGAPFCSWYISKPKRESS